MLARCPSCNSSTYKKVLYPVEDFEGMVTLYKCGKCSYCVRRHKSELKKRET